MKENPIPAHELDQKLAGLAQQKRRMGGVMAAGFLCLLADAMLLIPVPLLAPRVLGSVALPAVLLALAGFGLIAFGGAGSSRVGRQQDEIRQACAPLALKRVMDRLDKYDPDGSVGEGCFKEELGLPAYDRLGPRGSYIRGVLRGIPLEACHFTLQTERWEQEKGGREFKEYDTVFGGVMVVCRHGLQLQKDFAITQYTRYAGGLKTGNEAFDRAFAIDAKEGREVFGLLTPRYMEKLTAFSDELGGRALAMRFCGDGRLLLVLRNRRLLEFDGEAGNAAGLMEGLVEDLEGLGDILNRLEIPARGGQTAMEGAECG